MKESQQETLMTCNDCGKQFRKKHLLREHIRIHEIWDRVEISPKNSSPIPSEKEETLSCQNCDFKCSKQSAMIAHTIENHKVSRKRKLSNSEKFLCTICGLLCSRKETLKSHYVRKHTERYEFSCKVCDKEFKIKSDLTTHTRLNHLEPPVVCDVCGKTCQNSHSLYTHQKHAHYKAKFECPVCHRRLVSKENLEQHIKSQHESKKFVCECGKSFFEKHDFQKHLRVHTGVKPYRCAECCKAFATHSSLSQHLLLHTGERIYECDVCDKSFAQKAGLLLHRKIHSDNLPPLPVQRIDHILKVTKE